MADYFVMQPTFDEVFRQFAELGEREVVATDTKDSEYSEHSND